MQKRLGPSSAPDCHDERIGDELRCHGRAHRPAHHPPGEQIDDGSHVKPAFRRPDVGKICNPFAVGRWRIEGPVQHVRGDGGRLPVTRIGRQAPPSRPRVKGLPPHQPLDPMQSAGDPLGKHVFPNAPGTVGTVAGKEARPHLGFQFLVAAAARAARARQPGVEATTRDPERPAYPSRRPDSPVLRDESELHVLSFAK